MQYYDPTKVTLTLNGEQVTSFAPDTKITYEKGDFGERIIVRVEASSLDALKLRNSVGMNYSVEAGFTDVNDFYHTLFKADGLFTIKVFSINIGETSPVAIVTLVKEDHND